MREGKSSLLVVSLILSAAGLAVLAATLLHGCGGDVPPAAPTAPPATTFVQVERLGRPAINEGLLITNNLLNTWNSVPPSLDLSPAAVAIQTEAEATITAVGKLGTSPSVTAIVGAFLPDVMRIDTTQTIAVGTPAYSGTLVNAVGSPIGGRKIEDDVIDVTLTVLVGAPAGDNVPYTRPSSGPGSGNDAIGHSLLHGQTAPLGTATFPYLATPD